MVEWDVDDGRRGSRASNSHRKAPRTGLLMWFGRGVSAGNRRRGAERAAAPCPAPRPQPLWLPARRRRVSPPPGTGAPSAAALAADLDGAAGDGGRPAAVTLPLGEPPAAQTPAVGLGGWRRRLPRAGRPPPPSLPPVRLPPAPPLSLLPAVVAAPDGEETTVAPGCGGHRAAAGPPRAWRRRSPPHPACRGTPGHPAVGFLPLCRGAYPHSHPAIGRAARAGGGCPRGDPAEEVPASPATVPAPPQSTPSHWRCREPTCSVLLFFPPRVPPHLLPLWGTVRRVGTRGTTTAVD